MPKRTVYTSITPLPSNVPRQLALELLHSHEEVIELNPLVTGVKAIEAPRDAPSDEYFSQWYEINEVITWGWKMRKKIAFKGVFHNQPYGLQSHVYAPFSVDLRNKYSIGGNQPGEPRETRELGVDTPQDGLYLREDVEIICNLALASFVKKETKDATGKMIERLARKAELLDEGKLHAMFENGKLKTAKPGAVSDNEGSLPNSSPPGSPAPSVLSGYTTSSRPEKKGYGNYHDVQIARNHSQHSQNSRGSMYTPIYGQQQQGYNGQEYYKIGPNGEVLGRGSPSMPMINELPANGTYHHQTSPGQLLPGQWRPQQEFRSELPGDSSFSVGTPSPQPSPGLSQGSQASPGLPQASLGAQQPSPNLSPPPTVQPAPTQQQYHLHEYQEFQPPPVQHPADRARNASVASGPDHRRSNSYTGSGGQNVGLGTNVAEWQQRQPNGNQARGSPYEQHAQPGHSNVVPDHQRFSALSIQQTPVLPNARPTGLVGYASTTSKCPVCGLFEGDEAAVSHHVSNEHFT